MRNETREKFNLMCVAMAQTYGVQSVAQTFAASPSIEQRLMDKIVESVDFLQRINVVGVRDLVGEKVYGSVSGLVGKRTDTDQRDRQTSSPLNLDANGYVLAKTEYDVHVKYLTMDTWSKFPDLYDRYMRYVRHAIALTRIKTGFYGIEAAAETNAEENPLGEDVNKGWLQILREYNDGANFLTQGKEQGAIRLGPNGDYENLDEMVHDVLQMVHPIHREKDDLVAIVGRDLLATDKAQLYKSQGQTPSEKERIENNAVTRTYGSLPAHLIPNFPSRGLLITSYDNLSLYYQEGAVRQKIEDNAKRDRIEHYNTLNEGYVIEDEEKASAIEHNNVQLWNGEAFV